ncbi:MAG: hypothetical protein KBI45_00215 [Candidatus Saccharicenans sp.]|jgi:hypothetical protein|nr:hypothetical protein [Candidatus Saccharicenans sp.]
MNNASIWISLASVFIAGMALGWNIYRDLRRPRLKVTFGFRELIDIEGKEESPFLMLFYTNQGPGKINIDFIILKKRWAHLKMRLNKEGAYSLIISKEENPLSDPLPTTLNVGERRKYCFPKGKYDWLKEYHKIGMLDSFGRFHWAPRTDYKRVIKQYEKKLQ